MARVTPQNCIGLIACGGKSSRMGTSKCDLSYHTMPQYEWLFNMLDPFCSEVYLSINDQQQFPATFPQMVDAVVYRNIGPMAAVATATQKYPGKHLLLVGCDYPLLLASGMSAFFQFMIGKKRSGAFYNNTANCYEPLLALYHVNDVNEITSLINSGNYSLQYFLHSIDAHKFIPENVNSIKSIDTVEERLQTALFIQQENNIN